MLDPDDDPERADLVDLRRQAMVARRHLVPQRELLTRLHQEPLPLLTAARQRGFRDAASRMARYVEDLESVRERTVLAALQLLRLALLDAPDAALLWERPEPAA